MLTKSGQAGQGFVGGVGPCEWLRVRVGHRDVLSNGSFEGPNTGVHPSAQLALREQREPAVYEVEPRGTVGVKCRWKHGRFSISVQEREEIMRYF